MSSSFHLWNFLLVVILSEMLVSHMPHGNTGKCEKHLLEKSPYFSRPRGFNNQHEIFLISITYSFVLKNSTNTKQTYKKVTVASHSQCLFLDVFQNHLLTVTADILG